MNKVTCYRWGLPFFLTFLLLLSTGINRSAFAQTESDDGPAWTIQRYLSVVAELGGVRFMPSEEDATPEDYPAGTVLWATGRSADSEYLYVQTDRSTDSESGWIARADVVAFGINLIPVREVPDFVMSGLMSTPEPSTAPSSQAEPTDDSAQSQRGTAVLPTAASEGDETETATVIAPTLNVRSGPGTEFDVLSQVTSGDELTVIETSADGAWVSISLSGSDVDDDADENITGWVSAQFVSSDPAALPITPSSSQPTAAPTGLSGTMVFQQSIGGQIYVYNPASGALRALTFGAEPALSPDGSTVAFSRVDSIHLINVDGSNERVLFAERELLGSPKWSPDGSTIIFTRGDEWQACVKGGIREVCTESSEVGEGKYKKIMYAIAAVDADGSNYRDVVSTKPARAPDWTEAGIVYQSIDGLQRTQADRDAENSLIHYDYLDPYYYDPDWQPGGNQIVFHSKEGSHWQIFTINSDGSGRSALTRPLTALVDQLPSSVAPAFSPDGSKIVFLSNRTPSGEAGAWKLWVMNADGSSQYQLPINLNIEYTHGVEQVVSWR